ncbi:MAG: hypothetical protein K6T61_17765 [Bryobacteraceae bacterium]|nr:hypothetical protein [Bryobacteraceae bacterium]
MPTSRTDVLADAMKGVARKGLREAAEAGIQRGGKELVENGMERAGREGLEEGTERAGRQGVEQPRCKQKNDLDEPSCFLAGTQIVVPGDVQNSVVLMVHQKPPEELAASADSAGRTERMLTSALLVGLGWTFSRRQRRRGGHAAVLAGRGANRAADHRTQNRHSGRRAVLGQREMRRLGPVREESGICLPPVRGTDVELAAYHASERRSGGAAGLPGRADKHSLPAHASGVVCPMRAALPRDAERGAARPAHVRQGSRLLAALCMVAALAVWCPLPAWLAGQRGEERHSAVLTAPPATSHWTTVEAQVPEDAAARATSVERRAATLPRGAAHVWTARGAERGPRPGAAPGPEGHPAAWATRSIECLQPGETVLAWDPATRRVRPQRIEATFVRTTRRLRVLEIADAQGRLQTLHTTDEHPFWSVDRRQFVAAGELHPGEGLLGLDGVHIETLAADAVGSDADHRMNPYVGDRGRAQEMEQDLAQAAQASRLTGQPGVVGLNDEIFRIVEALNRCVWPKLAAEDLFRVVMDERLPCGPTPTQALGDCIQRDDVDLALRQQRGGVKLLDHDLEAHATEARGFGAGGRGILYQGRGLGFWRRRANLNCRRHPRGSPRSVAARVIASASVSVSATTTWRLMAIFGSGTCALRRWGLSLCAA